MADDLTVRIDVSEIAEVLQALGADNVVRSAESGVERGLLAMVRDVTLNRMSGQYLGIVTGGARQSMTWRIARQGQKVVGAFGSPRRYVRAHEVGYRGPVSVPEHAVRGHTRRGSSVRAHTRRAHTRAANIRARHFMRDSLRDGLPFTEKSILRALDHLARTGQILRPGA